MTTENVTPETTTTPIPEAPRPDDTALTLDAEPAVKVEDAKPADKVEPDGVVEYNPTGDVGLDMALSFIGKAGIGMAHPSMVAALAGDFTLIKATLAAKGVAGWEQFVALGEASFARSKAESETKANANREAIYKEAGSKETWVEVQSWASANATAEEKAELNSLLNQGGLAARGAVQYLLGAYARAGNVTQEPKDALNDAGRRAAPGGDNAPLSARDYQAAVNALNAKLNGRIEGTKEYESLQRRRAAAVRS